MHQSPEPELCARLIGIVRESAWFRAALEAAHGGLRCRVCKMARSLGVTGGSSGGRRDAAIEEACNVGERCDLGGFFGAGDALARARDALVA